MTQNAEWMLISPSLEWQKQCTGNIEDAPNTVSIHSIFKTIWQNQTNKKTNVCGFALWRQSQVLTFSIFNI